MMKTKLTKTLALIAAAGSIAATSIATSSLALSFESDAVDSEAVVARHVPPVAAEPAGNNGRDAQISGASKAGEAFASAIPISGYAASALFGSAILLLGGLARRFELGASNGSDRN